MKFVLILACVALFVACTEAQARCKGRPDTPRCVGKKDEGNALRTKCKRNSNDNMWYWDKDARSCKQMKYKGCGGNNNRHCSKFDCVWGCNH